MLEPRYEDAVRTDEQFEVAPQGPQGKKSKLQLAKEAAFGTRRGAEDF